jgi:hypothetical protein
MAKPSLYIGAMEPGGEIDQESSHIAGRSAAVPGAARLLAQSVWPSARRAFASLFSIIAFPLFLLSLIGLAKILSNAALLDLSAQLRAIVGAQSAALEAFLRQVATLGLNLPAWSVDVAAIYLSIGATMARAEKDSLLAVELNFRETLDAAWRCIRELRLDYFFFAIPKLVRGTAVRCLWPLDALYRLSQPFEVEGPGPTGDDISTTVRRGELREFAAQVSEAGVWDKQTLYDHRQVLLWHVSFSLGAVYLTNLIGGLL